MADVESNIKIGVDADEALRQLKALQRQLSAFYSTMAKTGAAGAAVSQNMAQNLVNQINAGGKFYAEMKKIKTTTDTFNDSLEKNKFTMGQYFKYAGASTKTFGKLFKTEFDTINKVVRENVKTLQTQYIKMGRDANGALKAMSIRPLALDMNDYATKTAMAAQKQALLNQLLRQGSTQLLNFGKNTQWAGRQLMVGFTIPLTYFGSVAAKTFMELEEQAIRFKRVYGDMFTTSAETTKALKNVQLLANEFTKYGVAVADTMKMAADVAATGKVGNDLLVQVAQANKLAVLGGIDQQKSLDTIISLTSTFGITAEKTAQQIDFLNAVENQTILSIDDLTTAIPKAAPVIKQLGGDVKDLAFFMTAMREGGIQAGEGANALKSGLASIINPTKRASEFLSGFGINIKGIVDANQGNVKQLVIDVASALDTLDPLNRARAIEQLFGKFQFSRISTLFQNVIKEGTQAQTVAELTTATVEELAILSERELNKISESPMYKFKKQVQDLKTAIVPIGEQFLKALTPVIEFFGKLLKRFDNLSDGTKQFVVYLTTLLAGIGPIAIMSFGLLANGIANIIKLFTGVKSVFNKAGTSSMYLGEQVNYLTQEQLEAAAVASSLDQAHANLTQRFTSETQAVKALASAYNQANSAATNFSIGKGIANQPRMGFAKGIVSVPGPKGAGDIIPSMLSPGEAVIPADKNKKYSGLVKGIIAGNIPGFSNGNPNVGVYPEYAIRLQNASENMSQRASGISNVAQVLSPLALRVGEARGISPSMSQVGQGSFDPIMNEYESITQKFVDKLNISFDETYASIQDTNERFAKSWTAAGKSVESDVNQITKDVDKGVVRKTFGLDPDFYGTISTDVANNRSRRGAFLKSSGAPSSYSELRKSAKALYGRKTGMGAEDMQMGHVYGPTQMPIRELLNKPGKSKQVQNVARQLGVDIVEDVLVGINQTAQISSPSKKTRESGRDMARGFILGSEEYIDDARFAGRKLALSTVQGAYNMPQSQLSQLNRGVVGPTSPYNPNKGVMDDRKTRRFGTGGVAMGVSTLAMGASMLPGQVGDTAQKLIGPLLAATSILSMLPAKFAGIALVLAGLGAAIYSVKKAFNSAQDAALKLGESLGSGKKAMDEFAKFSGKVTATEIMDRRRQNLLSPFQIQTGKTTFGQSFVQSDLGKQLIKSLGESIKTSGRSGAQSQLVNQLATAVSSGALTAAQARSVAQNIAQELGDYSFGIQVNAKVIDLIGPNGENLNKDPLAVRIKMIDETRKTMGTANRMLGSNGVPKTSDYGKSALYGVGGGIAGGLATGLTLGAATGSFVPGIGTAIGAGVGMVAGGIYAMKDRQKRLGEASGASIAIQKIAVEQQQQLMDSLDLEYEKRIESARAIGDTIKANELILKQEEAKVAMLEKGTQLTMDIQNNYANASGAVQNALMTGVNKAITAKYKGTASEDIVPLATDMISGAGLKEEQQYTIKFQLASGQIDPMQVVSLFEQFGEDKETLSKVIDITTKFGGKFADQAVQVISAFQDKNGDPNKKAQTKFVADISTKTPKEAQKMLTFFADITKTGEVLNTGIAVEFLQKNPEVATRLEQTIADIKAQKGKIDLTIAATILGAEEMEALRQDQEYFMSLPPEQQKIYLQTLTTMAEVTGNNSPEFLAWQRANPGASPEQYMIQGAQQVTKVSVEAEAVNTGELGEDVGGTGPTSSPLDELVKKIREVRSATQELTIGWESSASALKNLVKRGIEGFQGLAQKLRGQGASQSVIDFITGLSPDDYDKYKGLFKDIETLQKVIDAIAIGEYQNQQEKNIADAKNQALAFEKLTAAGMDVSSAYDAVQDSAFASSVATNKLGKDMQKIIDITNKSNLEKIKTFFKFGEYAQAFDPGYDAANKFFDVQEKLIKMQRRAETSKQELIIKNAEEQIKSAQNIIDTNNYQISRYEDGLKTIDDQAEKINERYEKQFESLDKINKINEVIARQEQGRLSVAQALSQGDIFAAARAVQELRAQSAQDAITQQRAGMEAARDAQINRLTAGGLTRDQLEAKVNAIKKQNYRIEQDIIAPLQEQARLAQVQLDAINKQIEKQVEGLTIAGMTKQQWEDQKVRIDVATTASGKYNKVLQDSLTTITEIDAMWTKVIQQLATYSGINIPGAPSADTGPPPPPVDTKLDTKKLDTKKLDTKKTQTSKNIYAYAYTPAFYAPVKTSGFPTLGKTSGFPTLGKTSGMTMLGSTIKKRYMGGMISKFASGGFAVGTDTVPAMLTPGEFIVSKYGVDKFGVDNLRAINKGEAPMSSSVYNYNLNVNVKSDANPNEIARTVMMQIKQIDSQRIKGNRI